MFTFDVHNEKGETVFTLTQRGELFAVSSAEEMNHGDEMEWAHQFPLPIYNHCMYGMIQLAVILRAYSESEYERFLRACGKEGG